MQEQLKLGDRVKHATRTDWGLGEVLADAHGGRIRIFFEDVGVKEFQLDTAKFIQVFGEEADSTYLTALVKRFNSETKNPKQAHKSKSGFIPFAAAIANFLSYFPKGFQDPKYLKGASNEREYKDAATELMRELLGREVFQDLLRQGQFKVIVERAKKVMNNTTLIHHYEKIWFANGLATDERQKQFAESLFDLLYGNDEMRVRFERFSTMLYEMKAAKWPIITYFLFIAFPDRHLFLKPEVTRNAANILNFEINYRPELNWLTYSLVLEMADSIRDKLNKDGGENFTSCDMIDIQSFIWIIAPEYYG